MKCPTVEINLKGIKTIINTSDFDPKTMNEWSEEESENDIELDVPLPSLKPTEGRSRKNKF